MPALLSTHSPEERARAATALLALSRLGHVYEGDLLEHGRVVLGHDLDARWWTLPGLGTVRVRKGAGVTAMRIALALAVSPRRVRLGASWIKDAAGKVIPCIPAALEPEDFARWLRAETLAQVRQMVSPSEKPRREARAPRRYRPAALDLVSEYTHDAAMGPEEAMIARETLADLLALVGERDRKIVTMRIEGHSTTEIAARLGCTDRSVRRYLACTNGRWRPGYWRRLAVPWSRCGLPASHVAPFARRRDAPVLNGLRTHRSDQQVAIFGARPAGAQR